MNTSSPAQPTRWPRKIRVACASVTVDRRDTPGGNSAFMVANYADGKRRFDCYATEADALDAANRITRQLSERGTLAATLTSEEAAKAAAAGRMEDGSRKTPKGSGYGGHQALPQNRLEPTVKPRNNDRHFAWTHLKRR